MRRWLLLICWLLVQTVVYAQDSSHPTNEFYLKLSPLALLENDGGIGISGEYILVRPKLGIQLEVQPVFTTINNGNGLEAPVNTIETGAPLGIELRPELRYYFQGVGLPGVSRNNAPAKFSAAPRRRPSRMRTYTAIDFLYKYIQRERLGEFTIANNGGLTPGFRRRFVYTDVKTVTGFDIKFGFAGPMGKSDRWLIEAYIGLGSRRKKFSYKNFPDGFNQPSRRQLLTFGPRDRENSLGLTRSGFSLPAGIKLVYKL